MPFTLVVPDLLAAREPVRDPPALPALDRLLAMGSAHAVAAHWREGVARQLGLEEAARRSCAQVAAWALSRPPAEDTGVVLATPVHCIAGISRVNLHPAGVLRLPAEELQELADSFARTLGGEDLQLAPLSGGFLMHGELLRDVTGRDAGDPVPLQGAALAGELPGSTDARLQRLGAEIQMWLHEHALNRARERRGALPVTALWLWGAGRAAAPQGVGPLPTAYAADPWISGLWTASQAALRPPGDRYRESGSGPALAVATVADALDRGSLHRLESDWFAPLLAALQSGALASLTLHLGAHRWQARRRRWGGLWRRPVPWWQRLAA